MHVGQFTCNSISYTYDIKNEEDIHCSLRFTLMLKMAYYTVNSKLSIIHWHTQTEREREREKERERETERERGERETDRQTDKQTDRQTDRQTYEQTEIVQH